MTGASRCACAAAAGVARVVPGMRVRHRTTTGIAAVLLRAAEPHQLHQGPPVAGLGRGGDATSNSTSVSAPASTLNAVAYGPMKPHVPKG